jgi:hypothetical protein
MRQNPVRKFTAQAKTIVDLLSLSLDRLLSMKLEFPDTFNELFLNAHEKLIRDIKIKVGFIRQNEL